MQIAGFPGEAYRLKFLADDGRLAVLSKQWNENNGRRNWDTWVTCYDIHGGDIIWQMSWVGAFLREVIPNPFREEVLVRDDDRLQLINSTSGELLLDWPGIPIGACAFITSDRVATFDWKNFWCLNLKDKTLIRGDSTGPNASELLLHPDGKTLVASWGEQERTGLWFAEIGEDWVIRNKKAAGVSHEWDPYTCAFSPDGELLAYATNYLRVLEFQSGSELAKFDQQGHTVERDDPLYEHAELGYWQKPWFSSDSQYLLAQSPDQTVFIWDLAFLTKVKVIDSANGRLLAVTPDWKFAGFISSSGEVEILELDWHHNEGDEQHD